MMLSAGWWGKKTAVREYAPRRARSAAGSPATPATALPNARARPSRPRQPHFQAYWQQPQLDEGITSGVCIDWGMVVINIGMVRTACARVLKCHHPLTMLGEVRNVADSQGCHVDVMLLTPAGQVFQATLRVDGADRSQGFVSIGGLTSDVLVKVLPLTLHGPPCGLLPGNRICYCCALSRALIQSCVVQLQR